MIALALLLAAAEHPCLSDAYRLCKGVDPGGGRVLKCLQKHDKELSPECRQKRDSFREKADEIKKSCDDDYDRFCNGVIPGRASVLKCLANRYSELSPQCKKDMSKAKKRLDAIDDAYHSVQQVCSLDLQRFCTGIDVGGGGTEKCLDDHRRDLTVDCKQAYAKWKAL